jgi:hypothetical protein
VFITIIILLQYLYIERDLLLQYLSLCWDVCVGYVCVFITAGPIIKLCAGGEGDSEGHVL